MSDPVSLGNLGALTSAITTLNGKITALRANISALSSGAGGSDTPSFMGASGTNVMANSMGSMSTTLGSISGKGMAGSILGMAGAAANTAFQTTMALPAQYNMGIAPDMNATMTQAGGFYRAAMISGVNRQVMEKAVFSMMGNGLTSPQAAAQMTQYMTQQGVGFGTSTFKQMAGTISNISRYTNMDTMSAAQAVVGLTSGAQSAQIYGTTGILTSSPNGSPRKMEDIFASIDRYLTIGQKPLSADEWRQQYYQGYLKNSLDNMGLTDAQQQLFLQYEVNKAGGKSTKYSDKGAMNALIHNEAVKGNENPYSSIMATYSNQAQNMGRAESNYIAGVKTGSQAIIKKQNEGGDLASAVGGLSSAVTVLLQSITGRSSVGKGSAGSQLADFALYSGSAVGNAQIGFNVGTFNAVVSGAVQAVGAVSDLLTAIKAAKIGGGVSNLNSLGSVTDTGSSGKMMSPSNRAITATYGERGSIWARGYHTGIDYADPEGTPVYAAASGKVSNDATGAGSHSYGNYVTIAHDKEYSTLYAHLRQGVVHPGDTVHEGQLIGFSGKSGHVTGAHLHFEVRKNGQPVNPNSFLSGKVSLQAQTASKRVNKKSSHKHTAASGKATSSDAPSYTYGTTAGNPFGDNSLFGFASSAIWSSTTGNGGPSSGISLGGTTATGTGSGGIGNNIEINLNIQQASESEARRFANLVKQYLQQDSLAANMGRF